MAISESAATAVVTGNTATITTASFTPTASSLLVALCAMGNGAGSSSSLGAVTDSIGSTWTRLAGEASASGGDAEVWVCDVTASPSARTVTWDPGGTGASGLLLAVRVVTGAKARASQTGATAVNGGTATPSKAITTTTTGSLVMGAFATASGTFTMTANGSTTAISTFNGTSGDTAAAYKAAAVTGTPGSITIGFSNATASAVDRMALAEILASTGGSFTGSASDNAAATDTVGRTLALATRTTADNAGGTDAASRTLSLVTRTSADNAVATDTTSRAALTFSRVAADAAAATDSASRTLTLAGRTAADTATAADSAGRAVALARAAADTAHATDTCTGLVGRIVNDTTGGSDSASRSLALVTRTASDTAPAADALSLSFTRTAADSAPAADTATRAALSRSRTASDSAGGTDSAGRTLSLVTRTASDNAPATDAASRAAVSRSRTAVDSAAGTDSAARSALAFSRTAADTAAATDTAANSNGHPRSATDSAPATDAASRAVLALGRAVADAAHATETAGRVIVLVTRTASDNAPAADTAGRTRNVPRAVTDSAPASDAASRAALNRSRSCSDASGGASDSLSFFTVGTGAAQILANPNWPLVGVDVDFSVSAGPPNTPVTRYSLNAAALRRLITRKIQIRRGRQYELDQVQTGECGLEIPDPLEVLNPDNAGSAFNDGTTNALTPYRPMQVWAMWPNQPGSGNIWNFRATAGSDPSFASGTGVIEGTVSGTGSAVNSTAQAFQGSHSVLVTQAGAGQARGVYVRKQVRTAPGVTYTASAYVYATGGATINIVVVDASGTTHVGNTSTVQNAWKRIFVPWTALDAQETVIIYGSGVSTPTFYIDCVMLEFGNTANTWTASGPLLYPLFTGYVERFPTSYDMNGYRAQRPLMAVDALGLLALTSIRQSYKRTIQADTPQIVMALDDASGPPLVTGNPSGFGMTSISDSGTVGFGGDTQLDGTPAVSLSQEIVNGSSTSSTTTSAASLAGALSIQAAASISAGSLIVIEDGTAKEEWAYVTAVSGTVAPFTLSVTRNPLGLVGLRFAHASGVAVASQNNRTTLLSTQPHAAFTANFAGFTLEFWAKPTIGNVNVVAGENRSGSPDIFPFNGAGASHVDTFVSLQSDEDGIKLGFNDTSNPSLGSTITAYTDPNLTEYSHFPDGNWHYYAITVFTDPGSPTTYEWMICVDGQIFRYNFNVGTQNLRVARFNQIMAAASIEAFNGASSGTNFSVARVAFYNYSLSNAQMAAHAARGLGNKGEVTGTRAARLLASYWGGMVNVAGGFLEMADDFSYDPTVTTNTSTSSAGQARAVLDALQEIQESERGLVYAAKDGTVVVEDRESRYESQVSVATLGEDPTDAGAEYPYSDYGADFDPTYTFSQANLTSPYNQSWLPLVNSAALARYGQRVVSQQVQCVNDFDIEQAGVFYLTRYSAPRTRISKIVLRPSANPALWPTVLKLEISQRFTVKRRTPAGVTTTADHYVESITHSIDPESGQWETTIQMSPVFVPSAWVLGDSTYGVLGSTTVPIY